MATKYARLKFWWGEIEGYYADEAPYSAAQTKALGSSAPPPGIGVRRCQLVFNRTPSGSTEDVATTHMDFLNVTSGEPDDTWIDADFTTLEGAMTTWWNAIKGYVWPQCKLAQYRWYRIGPAVVPPNPPVKITTLTPIAGTGTTPMPPQVSATITTRPAVRREWGRMYIPSLTTGSLGTDGRLDTTFQNLLATSTDTLYASVATADFVPVVYSKKRGKAFAIESLQVDDVFDIQRRRRWDRPLSRVVKS